LPISELRLTLGLAAQRAVGLEDALGQRQHHPERMLGNRIGVAAGLIDDEHARRVQASTSTGSKPAPFEDTISRVRRPLQQILIDMEMSCDLVARRSDLIRMRRDRMGAATASGLSFSSRSSRTSARLLRIST
jgi:hypothetical protein